jgi:hypothetical protein
MTQKFNILQPNTHDVGHSVGEARFGFDSITSSYFHVIEYVDDDGLCAGVEIYSSETTTWIYKESEWGKDTDVTFSRSPSVFLNGCLHIMGDSRGTLRYLLWIWRKTHGIKLIGLVVFNTPCIKLRVTCVYVLLLVPMNPSFQFGSLKTMVLIIGH